MALDTFRAKLCICDFHVKCSSKITPSNMNTFKVLNRLPDQSYRVEI